MIPAAERLVQVGVTVESVELSNAILAVAVRHDTIKPSLPALAMASALNVEGAFFACGGDHERFHEYVGDKDLAVLREALAIMQEILK